MNRRIALSSVSSSYPRDLRFRVSPHLVSRRVDRNRFHSGIRNGAVIDPHPLPVMEPVIVPTTPGVRCAFGRGFFDKVRRTHRRHRAARYPFRSKFQLSFLPRQNTCGGYRVVIDYVRIEEPPFPTTPLRSLVFLSLRIPSSRKILEAPLQRPLAVLVTDRWPLLEFLVAHLSRSHPRGRK